MALANKLETIANEKSESSDSKNRDTENHQDNFANNSSTEFPSQEEDEISLPASKKSEVEIKPLSMTIKRVNPFLKTGNSSSSPRGKYITLIILFFYFIRYICLTRNICFYFTMFIINTIYMFIGLAGLNSLPEKSQKPSVLNKTTPIKPKTKTESKQESFIAWHTKNKKNLMEEFPDKEIDELTKIGFARYKEQMSQSNTDNTESPELFKKRKLPSPEKEENNEAKRSVNSKLSKFAFDK